MSLFAPVGAHAVRADAVGVTHSTRQSRSHPADAGLVTVRSSKAPDCYAGLHLPAHDHSCRHVMYDDESSLTVFVVDVHQVLQYPFFLKGIQPGVGFPLAGEGEDGMGMGMGMGPPAAGGVKPYGSSDDGDVAAGASRPAYESGFGGGFGGAGSGAGIGGGAAGGGPVYGLAAFGGGGGGGYAGGAPAAAPAAAPAYGTSGYGGGSSLGGSGGDYSTGSSSALGGTHPKLLLCKKGNVAVGASACGRPS